jgi:hypothetical protein
LFLFAEGNHLREPSHAKQYGDQMHTTVWWFLFRKFWLFLGLFMFSYSSVNENLYSPTKITSDHAFIRTGLGKITG